MEASTLDTTLFRLDLDPRQKLESVPVHVDQAATGHEKQCVMPGMDKPEKQEEFQIIGDVFTRWWRIGTAKGLMTDTQIARFLLDQYESIQENSAAQCSRCCGPLLLLCSQCDLTHQQYRTSHPREMPMSVTVRGILSTKQSTVNHDRGERNEPTNISLSGTKIAAYRQSPWENLETDIKQEPEDGQELLGQNSPTAKDDQLHRKQQLSRFPNRSSSQERYVDGGEIVNNVKLDPTSSTCLVSTQSDTISGEQVVTESVLMTNRSQPATADPLTSPPIVGENRNSCVTVSQISKRLETRNNRKTRASAENHAEIFPGQKLASKRRERKKRCRPVASVDGGKERKKKTSAPPHICTECGTSYAQPNSLKLHIMRCHTGERPYVCKICGASFLRAYELQVHTMQKHTGERPYACDQCKSAFSVRRSLTDHMKIHTKEKTHVCHICGAVFCFKSALVTHMRVHTKDRPFKCPECNKTFTQHGNMMIHMRQHTGEKPYACSQCGAAFRVAGTLKSHMLTHTGEKPYTCQNCGKGFATASALKIHRRSHTGDRPYVCEQCSAAFASNGPLKRHMRMHTGERPYICKFCGFAFARSHHLKTHVERKHITSPSASVISV